MLFPDWGNVQQIHLMTSNWGDSSRYTVQQDSFIIGLDPIDVASFFLVKINGKAVFNNTVGKHPKYINFYCSKGTVIQNGDAEENDFLIFPLVKSGGGDSLLHAANTLRRLLA